MIAAFIIFLILVLAVGFLFIYTTARIDKLDTDSRDKSSEIDGALWDRAFHYDKMLEFFDKEGIVHEMKPVDTNTFALGMPTLMQVEVTETMDKAEEPLREILKAHPELTENEEFKTHLDKFDKSRKNLIQYSTAYNLSAGNYNKYISNFPGSAMAAFHKKMSKNKFLYFFKDLD